MDYLRFILTAILAIVGVFIEVKLFGAGIGTFSFIGAIIAFMIGNRPASHSIALILWFGAIFVSILVMRPALHQYVLDHPEKYKKEVEDITMGLLFVGAAIVFHPICYGIGRVVAALWKKARLARQGQSL
jgi:hypothetical protein